MLSACRVNSESRNKTFISVDSWMMGSFSTVGYPDFLPEYRFEQSDRESGMLRSPLAF